MQIIKKILAILIVVVFVVGQFPLMVLAADSDFEIIDGTPVTAVPPLQLQEGEIWTGKSIEYHGDGSATITFLAWGRTYEAATMPLAPDNEYVIITAGIGEFSINAADLPAGLTFANNTVTWQVHQSNIVGAAPAQVSYVVFLGESDRTFDHWYATDMAKVTFYPAEGNPFYWTRSETTQAAFSVNNMNWNNGNGLNGGTIVDNILGVTINFGSNGIPVNRTAAQTPYPSGWNNNATVGGQTFRWHLHWVDTAPPQTYIFTVRNLGGLGIDVVYEVTLPQPGGYDSIAGDRTIISVEYFHRSGFNWVGDAVINDLEPVAQIMLKQIPPSPTMYMEIHKSLEGFYADWDVNSDTMFNAKVWYIPNPLELEARYALIFEGDSTYRAIGYINDGLVFFNAADEEISFVDTVSFSVNSPALLSGLPITDGLYIVEEIFEEDAAHISVTYTSVDNTVIVRNEYASGEKENGGNGNGNGSNGGGENSTPPNFPPINRPIPPYVPPHVTQDPPGFFTSDHVWFVRGHENTEMRPDNYITRAEAAMVFFRLLRPELKDFVPHSPFVDIVGDEWYGLAVSTVAYHRILYGFDNGEFMPQLRFTRNEFTKVFPDGNPFYGFEGSGAYLTRAEFVTAVNRMLKRHILLEHIPNGVFRFPDLNETHWAYADFMEAAHTHTLERFDDGMEIWTEIIENGLNAPFNR